LGGGKMKFYLENKLITIPVTFLLIIIIATFSYHKVMDKKLDQSFHKLSLKDIEYIEIIRSDMAFRSEYLIEDHSEIKRILSFLKDTDKKIVISNSHMLNNTSSYFLTFADSNTPPHLTHVRLDGGRRIAIWIYNYQNDRYEDYQGDIDLTDEEIKRVLFNK